VWVEDDLCSRCAGLTVDAELLAEPVALERARQVEADERPRIILARP
jgi:hypothetical protein